MSDPEDDLDILIGSQHTHLFFVHPWFLAFLPQIKWIMEKNNKLTNKIKNNDHKGKEVITGCGKGGIYYN